MHMLYVMFLFYKNSRISRMFLLNFSYVARESAAEQNKSSLVLPFMLKYTISELVSDLTFTK